MLNRIKTFLNLTFYVSGLDQFLAKFRQSQAKLSASQLEEQRKYQRIYALRDGKTDSAASKKTAIWDNF